MSTILVAGASGLLGTALVPELRAAGHRVVTIGRHPASDVRADLSGTEDVGAAVAGHHFDLVVNLVAWTNLDACEKDPAGAYAANVRPVEHLVHAIERKRSATHLIQISTDQVYDGVGPHGEGRVHPRNYYAFSKYVAELLAARVPATILRTNFVGKSGITGRRSLTDWLFDALTGSKPIRVFEDIFFSPLAMDTAVKFIERAATARQTGTYNMGAANGISKADFAFRFAAEVGRSAEHFTRGTSQGQLGAYRPSDMRMDSSRFAADLGVVLPTIESEIALLSRSYRT